MDNDNAHPSCLIYPLIVLGIILAVGVALLMSQVDALQQRTYLPQATLPVVDLEATVASGDLTVVVITGEGGAQSSVLTLTPTLIPETAEQETIEETPESPSAEDIVPTCSAIPDGWLPYNVQDDDSLRSLAIQLGIDEDSLAQANCLIQPQLNAGQIIYLPLSPEATAENPPEASQDP